MTASAIVLDPARAQVLLVEHRAYGVLVFPGGHVDPGETPEVTAAREVWEETGVECRLWTEELGLPGLTPVARPWRVFEIPAPAKPERPGKPAEAAHTHVDFVYLAFASADDAVVVALDEVRSVVWADVAGLADLAVRADVPILAREASSFVEGWV